MSALSVARVLTRASILVSMQYRVDFFFDTLYTVLEAGWTLAPLLVVFGARPTIAGWSLDEALLVVAWFTLLKSVLYGVFTPSIVATIEQMRRGTFDFVLLKPVDAQLYATFSKIQINAIADAVVAVVLGAVALVRLHHAPTLGATACAALLTLCAVALLYALHVAALCVAFYVARIDNLVHLLGSLFDAARWPSSVFRGAVGALLTFVLPLGLMTTYPPLALLGRLSTRSIAIAVFAAGIGLVASRLLWLRSLAAYRSAGG